MTPRQIKSMHLESITLRLVLFLTVGLAVVLWADSRPMVACLDVNTFAVCSGLDKGRD